VFYTPFFSLCFVDASGSQKKTKSGRNGRRRKISKGPAQQVLLLVVLPERHGNWEGWRRKEWTGKR
jgi:hypothetical protein